MGLCKLGSQGACVESGSVCERGSQVPVWSRGVCVSEGLRCPCGVKHVGISVHRENTKREVSWSQAGVRPVSLSCDGDGVLSTTHLLCPFTSFSCCLQFIMY